MKNLSLLLFLLICPLLIHAQTLNPKFEKKIETLIDKSVETISCERLNKKIETPNLYILDAREKKEYEISHLKDARWVGYEVFQPNALKEVPKDAIVVVYCSVGYRSEKVGEKLQAMGFSKVYNLYGGIFEWSNRAYPLVDKGDASTEKVHGYDQDWGKWIEKGDKVFK